jgi:hypothetical protein
MYDSVHMKPACYFLLVIKIKEMAKAWLLIKKRIGERGEALDSAQAVLTGRVQPAAARLVARKRGSPRSHSGP